VTRAPARLGRAAAREDIGAVAACLASAFYDDPLWGDWVFPDERRRGGDLLAFMTVMAELGFDQMWIDMTAGVEAITVWTPPGATYGDPEQEPLVAAMLDELFGDRAAELRALFAQFEEHTPAGRFYHLEWWATHRRHVGRGLGTALLREDLERVDGERLPAYLESTNPANLARYERFGFRRLSAFAPPGGPTITTMWREPTDERERAPEAARGSD
jgi:ribosomal protein S18 acetylase RimI-like enzyme